MSLSCRARYLVSLSSSRALPGVLALISRATRCPCPCLARYLVSAPLVSAPLVLVSASVVSVPLVLVSAPLVSAPLMSAPLVLVFVPLVSLALVLRATR